MVRHDLKGAFMSNTHWFVKIVSELAEEARKGDNPGVLLGLSHAIDTFCEEAGLSDGQRRQVSRLVNFERQRSSDLTASQ